jgi:hypothetical protein
MKIHALICLTASTMAFASQLAQGQESIKNPLIDYRGFQAIVDTANKDRESRRLTEDAFLQMMNEPGVVVLDARSASMYQLDAGGRSAHEGREDPDLL